MMNRLASYRWSMRIPIILSLSVIVSVLGCGGAPKGKHAPKPRLNVKGKVNVDGKPVAAGKITFVSNTTSNVGTGVITNGTYSNKSGEGPNYGENAVTVVATENGKEVWVWVNPKVDFGDKDGEKDFEIPEAETKKAGERVVDK